MFLRPPKYIKSYLKRKMGRCRVCGRIFCCTSHQKQHEKLEHEEYAKWLDILPVSCRTCGKQLFTIYDLNSKCVILNRHCFVEASFVGTPKPSRKRRLDENPLPSPFDENPCLKKRIVSKQLTKRFSNSPLLLLDLNGAKMSNSIIISPQLDVSYTVLSDAKSSTPLNEDKENLAVVSISVEHEATTYCTPDPSGSLILVSAMKKMPPQDSKLDTGRKVTFDTPTESEISVYGTPMVTAESDESISHQMIIVSPAIDENIESGVDPSEPSGEHKLSKMAKNVRLTLNGIPRSLTSMWQWTQRRIRRNKQRDEFDSPISKRNKMKATLKRKPIFSYWVSMSITSMMRDPLPTYRDRYSAVRGAE